MGRVYTYAAAYRPWHRLGGAEGYRRHCLCTDDWLSPRLHGGLMSRASPRPRFRMRITGYLGRARQ